MGPKTLRIDSTLESDLVPPVQNAETMLEHILKDAAGQVTVVWEPGEHEEGCDRYRPADPHGCGSDSVIGLLRLGISRRPPTSAEDAQVVG